MMNAEELLRELSSKLRLEFEVQDWGIVNADPGRLCEFIEFYETQALVPSQRFEVGELIIASANERLLAGAALDEEELQRFVYFMRQHRQEQEAHIAYWRELQSDSEFPIAEVLRQILC
jgi:hypothetical protein